MKNTFKVEKLIARLSKMDPHDVAIVATIDEMKEEICLLSEEVSAELPPKPFEKSASVNDAEFISEQISKLRSAALAPAKNYARIYNILSGLQQASEVAKRPQYASLRPRIANITEKVAGIFAEVDTVDDLDKPLEAIEKAIHSLYGNQSKNSTFYLERRGKGHSSKTEE